MDKILMRCAFTSLGVLILPIFSEQFLYHFTHADLNSSTLVRSAAVTQEIIYHFYLCRLPSDEVYSVPSRAALS